jgi:hypothetical protein
MSSEDNTIELFMWGYQRHFQISVQSNAERLFQKLDPNLEAQTFLLGLLREPAGEKHPVCLEPEDCGYRPSDFSSVREKAKLFLANDGMENVVAGERRHYDSIQFRRTGRAEASAVLSLLSRTGALTKVTGHFFSGFVAVGDYDVGIVLTLSHGEGISYYKLPKVYAPEDYHVPRSLLEAAARIFLQKCLRSLRVPQPEKVDDVDDLIADEVIRRAGNRLTEGPTFAAHGIEGLYGLFDACNYIASLPYEGAASVGGMVIAKDNHPNVKSTLRLAKALPLSNNRAIRKLLEVTGVNRYLLSNGSNVIGFGTTIGIYDQSQADLFRVRFVGHHKWELLHDQHVLMRVSYGLPQLPMPALSESRFLSTFEIVFGKANAEYANQFYELALEACRQRHGTLLLITPEAQAETQRLVTQATVIEPLPMTVELLQNVTAIDGAVILDLQGTCHAIGAILDGVATPSGNPGRGARYNSAVRYLSALADKGIPCLAVVVSEDGTSELFPNLPRRIPRSELMEIEAAVDELLGRSKWSLDRSFRLLKWLERHRFYLSDAFCEKANTLLRRHDGALEETGRIRIIRSPFTANPNMADVFLL